MFKTQKTCLLFLDKIRALTDKKRHKNDLG